MSTNYMSACPHVCMSACPPLGKVVHSGAAAERLKVEFDRHGLARDLVDLAVIGPRVAEMAGAGWRSVHTAEAPGDSELLALAQALCQTDS